MKIEEAIEMLKPFKKGLNVDLENRTITVPLQKGTAEEDMMSAGMLGAYFKENGFDVSFETKDVEYTTKGTWRNYRGWDFEKGHKAWLRNRLCMILSWEEEK